MMKNSRSAGNTRSAILVASSKLERRCVLTHSQGSCSEPLGVIHRPKVNSILSECSSIVSVMTLPSSIRNLLLTIYVVLDLGGPGLGMGFLTVAPFGGAGLGTALSAGRIVD